MTQVGPPPTRVEETWGTGQFRSDIAYNNDIPGYQSLPRMRDLGDGEPYLVGSGPVLFTTCVALERYPLFRWDTNCYYRDLGVSTSATKAELRRAYEAKQGWNSPRLTYVLKQLLNDEVRRNYDSTAFGCVFFDAVVEAFVRNEMVKDAVQAREAGATESDMEKIDLDHLMGQPFEVVDRGPATAQNGARHRWGWSYYLWQSEADDAERLSRWQAQLLVAFAKRKERTQIAVGYTGVDAEPVKVRLVGYRVVVFLHEDAQPTKKLGRIAASRVAQLLRGLEPTENVD